MYTEIKRPAGQAWVGKLRPIEEIANVFCISDIVARCHEQVSKQETAYLGSLFQLVATELVLE